MFTSGMCCRLFCRFNILKTVQAIAVLGNSREVDRFLSRTDQEKEVLDVCEALQEMIRDGEQIGEARGRLMGINAMITDNLEEGAAERRIVEKLKKHFSLTEKDAMEYLRQYQEQQLQS